MPMFQGTTASVATYNSPLIAAADGFLYVGYPWNVIILALGQDDTNAGTAPLRPDVPVSMCFINLIVFAVDGQHITTLPVSTLTVTPYVATAGTAPSTCSICCNWRGRFVLAGSKADPQNFFMARQGVPTDWNYAATDPAAAVAGNLSQSGKIGEPIMALIPYTDDILLVGCANSLWMLQGDPADGGTIVRVSDQMGILGPNAWCVDPQGTLYFLARGGMYSVRPMWEMYQPPQLMTGENYDQYFATLVTTQKYLSLQWDIDYKYMHIFATPVDISQATHLIYDARSGGLWPQQYPVSTGPTASIRYAANTVANNPAILLGGWDGYIRRWTPTNLTDDGSTIISRVILGPFRPFPTGDAKMDGTTVNFGEVPLGLPTSTWNAFITLNGGASAYDVTEGSTTHTATISTGLDRRQKTFRQRVHGGWFTVGLSNSTNSTLFSFESALLEFTPSGRNRYRR